MACNRILCLIQTDQWLLVSCSPLHLLSCLAVDPTTALTVSVEEPPLFLPVCPLEPQLQIVKFKEVEDSVKATPSFLQLLVLQLKKNFSDTGQYTAFR